MNPKLLKLLGNNNDPGNIRQIALNTAAVVGLTSSVFAIAGWFAVPLLIEQFFPDYTAVIEATRIMLIAGVFLSFRTMTIVFNALKQWRYLYIFGLFFLLSRFASLAILTPLVGPLLGVTLGSVFSFFASALIIIGMVILATRPKEIDSM
jgi:Na+-driven multidrug efflux pump